MTESTQGLTIALANRYRIERELGQGGMATVYLAEDLKHDRKVALKVLKPELAAVLGAERFVVEIKTTASLQHPHILPLFDSGTADGFLYYVMPFIQGETLRDKLNRETQLSVDEAVKLATDVADALHYAHQNGVIHRDIKPENILLANGRPMVADFGIALAVSAAAGGRMTESGLSLGTPHYMSPEQATAEKEITARSDVYSLASVLYEMLAGVPPHEGGSAQQMIMRTITETPRPVSDLRKAVPPHIEAAVMKALEKLPADRFSTAADFARALGDPSHLTWQNPARTATTPAASRGGRWLLWVPTAVAAAMTVLVAVSAMHRPVAAPRAPMRFTLASLGGEEMQSLSISTDGRAVAYSAMVDGVIRGYVRRLDALNSALVPGAEGVFDMTLHPNGRSVALADSRKRISLVPLDGGAARLLGESPPPAGLSWSKRGLVLGMPALSEFWGLTLVPATGAIKPTVLTSPGKRAMHHRPLVLDDGVTVLYENVPMNDTDGAVRLGVGNLETNTWTTTDLVIAQNGLVGFADGTLVYRDGSTFKAVRFDPARRHAVGEPVIIEGVPPGVDRAVLASNGTMVMHSVLSRYQLELVNERGQGDVLFRDTVSHVYPRFSPDGKRVALSSDVKPDAAAWVLDLASRTTSKLGLQRSYGLDWMPNGRTIVSANPDRAAQYLAVDGSDLAQPRRDSVEPAYSLGSVTISPDGKAAVFGNILGREGFNLVIQRLDGDTVLRPLLVNAATKLAPRFSPDGRWLAYSSDETGRQEIYLQPFPGPGNRVQVSTDGGEQPVWSSDGRLFYRAKQSVMVAQVSRTAVAASVTSRRKLFDGDFFGSGEFVQAYDVSPDGSHFLMARRVGSGAGQLIAWVDWMSELKSKLGK